jgi:hypothetical protein
MPFVHDPCESIFAGSQPLFRIVSPDAVSQYGVQVIRGKYLALSDVEMHVSVGTCAVEVFDVSWKAYLSGA